MFLLQDYSKNDLRYVFTILNKIHFSYEIWEFQLDKIKNTIGISGNFNTGINWGSVILNFYNMLFWMLHILAISQILFFDSSEILL